jgi:ankyrin repeat protein
MRTMRKLVVALVVPWALFGGAMALASMSDADRQLFEAVRAQDPETALYALSSGAYAKAREPDGTTPLHYAAHYGDTRLIAALLKGKADPNAENDFGLKRRRC